MKNKTKVSIFSAILLVAILLSACAGATTNKDAVAVHTLNVIGSTQAVLTPDVAYITIGVHTESPDAKEAVASNNTQALKVIEAINAVRLETKYVFTSNFSI